MDNDAQAALQETLSNVYEELNFPSVDVFYKALKKRGIPLRE